MDNAAGNSGNLPTLPRVEPLSGEIISQTFLAECLKLIDLTLFQRTGSDQWLNTDYDQLDSAFEIEGKTISLREVYSHLGK